MMLLKLISVFAIITLGILLIGNAQLPLNNTTVPVANETIVINTNSGDQIVGTIQWIREASPEIKKNLKENDEKTKKIKVKGKPLELYNAPIIVGQYNYYNNSNSYKLSPWKMSDYQTFSMVVADNLILRSEGLMAPAVVNAVKLATGSWDAQASSTLFGTIFASTTAKIDQYSDNQNTIGFAPINSTCLGYTRPWYSMNNKIAGRNGVLYYKVVQFDIVLNSNTAWGTGGHDVRTVVQHELGHVVGIGDTYSDPTLKYDLSQNMGFYVSPKVWLGLGDLTGVKKKYY